jgi:hypothetical protein
MPHRPTSKPRNREKGPRKMGHSITAWRAQKLCPLGMRSSRDLERKKGGERVCGVHCSKVRWPSSHHRGSRARPEVPQWFRSFLPERKRVIHSGLEMQRANEPKKRDFEKRLLLTSFPAPRRTEIVAVVHMLVEMSPLTAQMQDEVPGSRVRRSLEYSG